MRRGTLHPAAETGGQHHRKAAERVGPFEGYSACSTTRMSGVRHAGVGAIAPTGSPASCRPTSFPAGSHIFASFEDVPTLGDASIALESMNCEGSGNALVLGVYDGESESDIEALQMPLVDKITIMESLQNEDFQSILNHVNLGGTSGDDSDLQGGEDMGAPLLDPDSMRRVAAIMRDPTISSALKQRQTQVSNPTSI